MVVVLVVVVVIVVVLLCCCVVVLLLLPLSAFLFACKSSVFEQKQWKSDYHRLCLLHAATTATTETATATTTAKEAEATIETAR